MQQIVQRPSKAKQSKAKQGGLACGAAIDVPAAPALLLAGCYKHPTRQSKDMEVEQCANADKRVIGDKRHLHKALVRPDFRSQVVSTKNWDSLRAENIEKDKKK